MSIAIHIREATLAYNSEIVFSRLNIHLPAGKWTALLGPSGVGKTSLLRMMAGLSLPEESVQGYIDTDNALPLPEQVAYMAQTDLLLPWLNVLENATLGLRLRNTKGDDAEQQRTNALTLLEKVGLIKAMHLYPQQLSGGMRQRVALVRTLMEDKPIVLMDEPFSALDAITRYKLQALAVDLLKDKTVFIITHDPMEALRLSHEIYIMQGRPALTKRVASLHSTTPRELTDPALVQAQVQLYNELAHAMQDHT